jgi:type I restriction enzyme S subunit
MKPERQAIGDFATVVAGGTPQRGRKEYFSGHIHWVKTLDLNGGYVTSTEERITDAGLRSMHGTLNPVGTVMIAMYGGVGTIGKSGVLSVEAASNQAVASILPSPSIFDSDFLHYQLIYFRPQWMHFSRGNRKDPNINKTTVEQMNVWLPQLSEQKKVARQIRTQFQAIEQVRAALKAQLKEVTLLPTSIVLNSLGSKKPTQHKLVDIVDEVVDGIGKNWKTHSVLGATRLGLAPAREQPGKHAERYKPVTSNTVFYNPMRILIGSIAFVDEDDESGITSPDYVVLKGKPGVADSRWFYYWLRSPLGERCIQSLARGAVRERMLFNRLAEGEIELPDYEIQMKASMALAQIKAMRAAIQKQIEELEMTPQKLLAQVFEN